MWLVKLKYRILRSIVCEVVCAIRNPAVQDMFVAKMVVRAPDHELLLNPNKRAPEAESRSVESRDELWKQRASWDCCVKGGGLLGVRDRYTQCGGEYRRRFTGYMIIRDRPLDPITPIDRI